MKDSNLPEANVLNYRVENQKRGGDGQSRMWMFALVPIVGIYIGLVTFKPTQYKYHVATRIAISNAKDWARAEALTRLEKFETYAKTFGFGNEHSSVAYEFSTRLDSKSLTIEIKMKFFASDGEENSDLDFVGQCFCAVLWQNQIQSSQLNTSPYTIIRERADLFWPCMYGAVGSLVAFFILFTLERGHRRKRSRF